MGPGAQGWASTSCPSCCRRAPAAISPLWLQHQAGRGAGGWGWLCGRGRGRGGRETGAGKERWMPAHGCPGLCNRLPLTGPPAQALVWLRMLVNASQRAGRAARFPPAHPHARRACSRSKRTKEGPSAPSLDLSRLEPGARSCGGLTLSLAQSCTPPPLPPGTHHVPRSSPSPAP